MTLGADFKLLEKEIPPAMMITGKQKTITRVAIERAFQKATPPVQRRTKNEEKRFIMLQFNDNSFCKIHCKGIHFSSFKQAFRVRMYQIQNSVYEVHSHTLFDTFIILK